MAVGLGLNMVLSGHCPGTACYILSLWPRMHLAVDVLQQKLLLEAAHCTDRVVDSALVERLGSWVWNLSLPFLTLSDSTWLI